MLLDGAACVGPVHRRLIVVLALVTGIAMGYGSWWVAALFIAPLLLLASISRPEWIIVLFLTAGLYKQDPRIAGRLPYDLTVLLGVLLALVLVPRLRRIHIPRQSILLVPLFAMAGWGILSPANAYGADKALRFCALTALVTVASVVIIDSPTSLRRFLVALAVLGFIVSVDALRHPESAQWGRLTLGGSNPIPLGRIGAIAFAFAWIRFHFARNRYARLGMIVVLGFTAACTLASGSRGPVLSTVASLALLSMVTYSAHRRMPIAMGPLVACAALGVILVGFASSPMMPWHRFELLLSEDKGASILLRGFMFVSAWNLTLANPFGIGIGGFEHYAPLELRYPHNLLLEVGCELGWVPLITLAVFLGWGVWTTVRIVRCEYAWHTVFLGQVFLSALMNAMVSGDLNDNRLLYATFLLPFTYRRMQEACTQPSGEGATATGLAARGGTPRQRVGRDTALGCR
jgi:hypothetical protein